MAIEVIRSFIAIELPAQAKAVLARLQGQLKSVAPVPAKWADPDGIHLTLKFLGDIATSQVDGITVAAKEAATGILPFDLELNGLGAFPGLKQVQIVWVGVAGDTEQISRLQQRLESNLARLGFAPESRPFSPHLTLARLRDHASPQEREGLGRVIAATSLEESSRFTVDSIKLVRSQLTREGAVYSQIARISLK